MHLHISPNDSTPLYQQIVNQVKYMISSGQLRPGDELPPIRTLSETIISCRFRYSSGVPFFDHPFFYNLRNYGLTRALPPLL